MIISGWETVYYYWSPQTYFPSEIFKQVKYIRTRVRETQQETWDKRHTENNSKYLLVHWGKGQGFPTSDGSDGIWHRGLSSSKGRPPSPAPLPWDRSSPRVAGEDAEQQGRGAWWRGVGQEAQLPGTSGVVLSTCAGTQWGYNKIIRDLPS